MRFHTFPLLSGCNPSIRISTGVHAPQQRRTRVLLRWERALTLPVSIKNALFLLSQYLKRRWVCHSDLIMEWVWELWSKSGAALAQPIRHLDRRGRVWPPVHAAPCRRSRWKSRPPGCCRWSPAPPAGRWAAPSAPVTPPWRGQICPWMPTETKTGENKH